MHIQAISLNTDRSRLTCDERGKPVRVLDGKWNTWQLLQSKIHGLWNRGIRSKMGKDLWGKGQRSMV